ncbi:MULTISPECIES: SDR family oxidoreductase [Pelosinus]|uniref:Short chain dehydrogenase/reductase family oxidoreductase n=1 Tax=Pelosinus fermentans B4 TaxID=1149862 RepID=I9ATR7_9FIRM|nr:MULTISPECIES: SDR family oxidoreductase [Pelosinus]EIW16327.1 short chain dehydrogenase/reductase family oxidoreductase [Pelosinus fermentans B4]EIW22693.1 short-chain dehydrogenase/reductase SDR [Pelosinus fermentans A11]OAM95634.1 3-oxoacyl-(acyl-carrier-protein) reductase [Pelosinus fermentans DSM 17108]SDR30847.1 NAD(P)-dependent dehydrogenase, short-chain alcohol dehydrogenase family [Pelosinus fermentans]
MNQQSFPPQHQDQQPGIESQMNPRPISISDNYRSSSKLENKVALISGGDSGIGRAVALAFAKEGANVVISYLNEHADAGETKNLVEETGKRCLIIAGDIGNETFCQQVVAETVKEFGQLDILVNNAAEQHVQTSLQNISALQLERTFRTNIFSYFYLSKAALPHLKYGSAIINTASVTAYEGNEQLIDYSATKGAIVSFTRSLSQSLIGQGIRVNGVAPGPIWTPLIPASFNDQHVAQFGQNTPMKRAGQPAEVAPCYVFLASADSSYMSGQILHVNGGTIVNG